MVDDLSAFAEELVPEAFTRRHTAFRVHRVDEPLSGEAGFALFIENLLTYSLSYRCRCGVWPSRMIVIEGGDGIAWYWDDEDLPTDRTVRRVRRETSSIPEPWLFAIELERPAHPLAAYWEEQPDGNLLALPNPSWQDLSWFAVWYAEARGRGVAATTAGVVHLEHHPHAEADVVVGQAPIAVIDDSVTRDFHRVLYGHPARKAHPLRGS